MTTVSAGIQRPSRTSGAKLTEPRPPIVISAKRRPASSPPGTALPQSITRVPPSSVRDRDAQRVGVGGEEIREVVRRAG